MNDEPDSRKNMVEWAKSGKEVNNSIRDMVYERGLGDVVTTKEELMNMGASLWPISYAFEQDDSKAFARIIKHFAQIGAEPLLLAAGAPDMQLFFSWLARWADQAFPHIILGQKTAAAMMATSANEEILDEVHAPWKAFLVDVPLGLIEVYDPALKKQVPMTMLGVQTYQRETSNVWNWRLSSPQSSVQLWRFGISSRDLIKSDIGFDDPDLAEMYSGTVDDQDERVAQLIGRLIIAICLSFPGNNKAIGPSHKHKGGWTINPKGERICSMHNFELRPPIKIDCRDVIKDYIQHGLPSGRKGSSPTVRTLVRGYYRRPPYGIEKGLAKTVWVQPAFRGPEDGKVVIRAHKETESK